METDGPSRRDSRSMNPTCIRLGGPSDILAVLPYQLGFHPRDSLVVVSLHGTRMGLVQRIDLPAAEHAPGR